MTEKGWKAIVKAAPDHVNSVRTRLVDHLTSKDQEDLSKIFNRVTETLRDQFINEGANSISAAKARKK
jgi:hypothetical protein